MPSDQYIGAMRVMIACSPSTGSSLLRRMLNRHSLIFCGSETSLLAKKSLYRSWKFNKWRLTRSFPFGLVDAAWLHKRGLSLDEEYPVGRSELELMIKNNTTYQEFVDSFFNKVLEHESKQFWIEKTPSNALSASAFIHEFNCAKLIHICRDPYDTIASLMNRGMDVYNACAVYLINTSALLEIDSGNMHLCSYEDLVGDPQKVLTGILEFIGLKFEESMLDSDKMAKGVTQMKGWKYDETAKVGKESIGRFSKMDTSVQHQIATAINTMRLGSDVKHTSIAQICETLSYDMRDTGIKDLNTLKRLRKIRSKDLFQRTVKLSYFRLFNYPIQIEHE